MKHLLSIIIIFTLSFQAFSQKKQQKKTKSKANNTQTERIQEAVPKMEPTVIDTLYIYKGQRYVFIIDVDKYSSQSYVEYASNNNSEESELQRNFFKRAIKDNNNSQI